MERFRILKTVGDGTFGTVYKAVNRSTGEVVAIKKMKRKIYSWEECLQLREIKSLRKLSHNHIVKLKEVIRVNDELHLVFEFLEQNVYQLMKDRTQYLPEAQIRSIIYQSLLGLAYCHKQGFFHRDLKPENMMVTKELCKLADFGLAKEIRARPPFTDYVSTRWYRAPEILLRSTAYNAPVDIFALGCIMIELYNLRPLAPGENENDQMHKLCRALGTPSPSVWAEGYRLASKMNFHFPQFQAQPLSVIVPNACVEGIQLLQEMLHWDPQKRLTASQCLQHPYFANFQPILTGPQESISRGSQASRGGVPNVFQRTNSKWSDGSGRLGDKSSKGRIQVKAAGGLNDYGKKDVNLPRLREVPENNPTSFIPRRQPIINPTGNMFSYGPSVEQGEQFHSQAYAGQNRENAHLPPIANPGFFPNKASSYKPQQVTQVGYNPVNSASYKPMGSYAKPVPMQPGKISHLSNAAALGGARYQPRMQRPGMLPGIGRRF